MKVLLAFALLFAAVVANGEAILKPISQPIVSSCEQFNYLLKNTGVRMGGNVNPGTAGKTMVRFATSIYTDLAQESNIPTHETPMRCFRVMTSGSVNVSELQSIALEWIPVTAGSNECHYQRYEWNRKVLIHENTHIQDAYQVSSIFKDALHHSFVICGLNRNDVEEKLNQQLQYLSKQVANAAHQEFVRRSNDFHESDQGMPIPPLNCNLCK